MKIQLLLCSTLLALAVCVPRAVADPLLPYLDPVAAQIQSDLEGGVGDAQTLNRALSAYQKNSKSLSGDTTILRNVHNILGEEAGYVPLLATAALNYQGDFQGRRDELYAQLVPAPISANRTSARTALRRVDVSLSNAVNAASTSVRIRHLQTAAQRLGVATNSVRRALRTKPGLSKVVSRVGVLSFNSEKGQVSQGGDFVSSTGGAYGEFGEDGILTIGATDQGSIVRNLLFHLEGVSSSFPAIYPLGVGQNSATYTATDTRRNDEFRFRVAPSLTNSAVTNNFLSIDYIGTNLVVVGTNTFPSGGYILGRFSFIGTNVLITTPNTNTLVTVSEGEYQLNFDLPVDLPAEEGNE